MKTVKIFSLLVICAIFLFSCVKTEKNSQGNSTRTEANLDLNEQPEIDSNLLEQANSEWVMIDWDNQAAIHFLGHHIWKMVYKKDLQEIPNPFFTHEEILSFEATELIKQFKLTEKITVPEKTSFKQYQNIVNELLNENLDADIDYIPTVFVKSYLGVKSDLRGFIKDDNDFINLMKLFTEYKDEKNTIILPEWSDHY